MDWLTNEVLFYGGITVTVTSAVAGVIHFVASRFKALRLKTQLTAEYGEMEN